MSLSILCICLGIQIYSAVVEPELEQRLAAVVAELHAIEGDVLREEYFKQVRPQDADENDGALADAELDPLERFRRGELTSTRDPRYARYTALIAEIEAIRNELPAMRFGYRPALDGLRRMITAMFTHAGWLHLLGNMWFLYLVGCNLEDRWGRWQFTTFYLIGGCVAGLGFDMLHADETEPLVGASGAVAAAMGAFMVCFARSKVKMLYVYVIGVVPRWGTFRAPAWVLLMLWMLEQLVMSYFEIKAGARVAYSAHAAGFAFGAVVALLLRQTGLDDELDEASSRAAEGPAAWSEHPEFLRILALRDAGDQSGALQALTAFTASEPAHLAAREMLLELGLEQRDLRAVDLALPFVIDSYHRKQSDERQIELYRTLRRAQPNYGLTDVELLRVASAASRKRDLELVIRAVSELMQQHPDSPLLPRAYWTTAETQARSGAHEQQRETLTRIVARFPDHACAALARDQLTRMQVA